MRLSALSSATSKHVDCAQDGNCRHDQRYNNQEVHSTVGSAEQGCPGGISRCSQGEAVCRSRKRSEEDEPYDNRDYGHDHHDDAAYDASMRL